MRYTKPSVPNSKADHRGKKQWWDFQKAYARAQLDYPEGLGLRRTLRRKQMQIGWRALWQVPPDLFYTLIQKLRADYATLKKREHQGETILPDTSK